MYDLLWWLFSGLVGLLWIALVIYWLHIYS
jgi:hypothetical protein